MKIENQENNTDTLKQIITLLPKRIAKEGYSFRVSSNSACITCKFYDVCMSKLIPNKIYVVKGIVRKIPVGKCLLTGEDLIPVSVSLKPIIISIPCNTAIRNIIIRYHKVTCSIIDCNNRKYCFPYSIYEGEQLRILDIHNKIKCPLGRRLVLVSVVPP